MFILKDGTTDGKDTTPEIRTAIQAWLQADGMIIRTKAQDDQVVAQAVADATKALNLDTIVKDATGIERNSSEANSDYIKRAVNKKLEEITDLKTKVAKYEKDGADGSVLATEYKERLRLKEEELVMFKKQSGEELTRIKEASFQSRVDAEINSAVLKIPVMKMHDDAQINTQLQDEVRRARVTKFKAEVTATDQEGTIVYKDKSGKIIRKSTDATPDVIENIIVPYFDPIRDKSNTQGGAGSNGGNTPLNPPLGGGGSGASKWANEKLADNVKSQMELTQWLTKEKKLPMDSKEFSEAFAHFNKDTSGAPLPFKPAA